MALKPNPNAPEGSPAEEAADAMQGAAQAAEAPSMGQPATGAAPGPDQDVQHAVVHRPHGATAPYQP